MYEGHQYSTQAPNRAEHIMSSVEGHFFDEARPNSASEGRPRALEAAGPGKEGQSRPLNLGIDTDHVQGKRRTVTDNDPSLLLRNHFPSRGYNPERTVLVPIEHFRKTYVGDVPFHDPRDGGDVIEPAHSARDRPYGFMTDRSGPTIRETHDSTSNAIFGLPAHMSADTRAPRRPHLQVQLGPRDTEIQGRSPFPLSAEESKHHQTLHTSHSSRSLLASLPIDHQPLSEHDRHVYANESGGRGPERIVPVIISSSPPRAIDRDGFIGSSERLDSFRAIGAENDRHQQTQLVDSRRERPTALFIKRLEDSYPRPREALSSHAQHDDPEVRNHGNGPYPHPRFSHDATNFSGAHSVPYGVANLQYVQTLRAKKALLRSTCIKLTR